MDAEYQLDIDVQKMCRLCLTVDESNLKSFFCSDILGGAIVAIPKIYENITDIQVNKDDKLPPRICVACKTKISEFHLFKQKCINSNALLCKILNVTVPTKAKTIAKPSQADKASQSVSYCLVATATQTTEDLETEEPKQSDEFYMKILEGSVFKHEVEQRDEYIMEQEIIEEEEYGLDYERLECLSTDEYVVADEYTAVEDYANPFADNIEYKVEVLDDAEIEDVNPLQLTDTYSFIESKKPTKRSKKKSTEICNICRMDLSPNIVKSHRNLHQQTLPMILDSIPYFRCGSCKTVFLEISNMESHFTKGACCSYVDEPTCTDYQYIEDFPEFDTEEGGPFSGCRTLRLCSVMQSTDGTFSCELCYNYTSSNVNDVFLHSVKHFSNDKENNVVYYDEIMRGSHRCGICRLNQPSLSAALRHVFFHMKTFLCPIRDCDDIFDEFRFLSFHIEQRHMAKENVKHLRCMHCGEISENYRTFRQHQRKECLKKIFRCDVCDKRFFHKSSLSMHMKYHLAAKYACEVCNKTFSQLCDYKVHFRIHSGEKPYKCEYCDKAFRSISNRKDHMSTHQTDKLFTCEICNQTFKSERTLRGHYPIHNPIKKFQCDQCDKSFHRRFHLTLHARNHEKRM
ncbi:Zinc finger protein [Pseudolycoriella hygida]|uniref:Zinc finger protein n=1 Tax=Pseudolycoriella hygida TaxID=35572 RepID=A0A9Q0MNB4_9DIPT|nr:Zinc finger protein [Pseudolycoriella hygida]